MTARPVALLLFGSCVALILGGCSGQPATRAGADSTSRALTAAAYFPGGYPSGDTLDQPASHVAANSSGFIRIAEGPSPYTQTNKDPGSHSSAWSWTARSILRLCLHASSMSKA